MINSNWLDLASKTWIAWRALRPTSNPPLYSQIWINMAKRKEEYGTWWETDPYPQSFEQSFEAFKQFKNLVNSAKNSLSNEEVARLPIFLHEEPSLGVIYETIQLIMTKKPILTKGMKHTSTTLNIQYLTSFKNLKRIKSRKHRDLWWRALTKSLPIFHSGPSSQCSSCGAQEDIQHILLDCPLAITCRLRWQEIFPHTTTPNYVDLIQYRKIKGE